MQPLLTPILIAESVINSLWTKGYLVLTHVTRQHDLALPTIESEQEFTLHDNTVVDGHGPVDWRLHPRSKVNETSNAAIGHVNRRLFKL